MANASVPAQQVDVLINGFRTTQLLHAVARLHIADQLHRRPQTAAELAANNGVHAEALRRVLRTLSSLGIFAEDDEGRWTLTELAQPLRSDVADSRHAAALMWGHPNYWDSYGKLLYSVQTGRPAFEHVYGIGPFDYYAAHPEAEQVFNGYMSERTGRDVGAIAAAYDFGRLQTVVDVGGGHGALLSAILGANPQLRGMLFDQAIVLPEAERYLATRGLRERCTLMAGDFFSDALPSQGDLYLLKWVIHDWDDERALHILRRCREQMAPSARLLLIEQVIRPGNPESYRTDIAMLLITGGRERTEAEYRDLLEASGFRLARMIPTCSSFDILEALPAGER